MIDIEIAYSKRRSIKIVNVLEKLYTYNGYNIIMKLSYKYKSY